MSIGSFTLADASIAQIETNDRSTKRSPPKRTAVALSDRKAVAEPR
jgi:hypothetical protein